MVIKRLFQFLTNKNQWNIAKRMLGIGIVKLKILFTISFLIKLHLALVCPHPFNLNFILKLYYMSKVNFLSSSKKKESLDKIESNVPSIKIITHLFLSFAYYIITNGYIYFLERIYIFG